MRFRGLLRTVEPPGIIKETKICDIRVGEGVQKCNSETMEREMKVITKRIVIP